MTPSPPVIVNEEKEWKVEKILNSYWYQRRFQFLVKWQRAQLLGICLQCFSTQLSGEVLPQVSSSPETHL